MHEIGDTQVDPLEKLKKELLDDGCAFETNVESLPGKPDLVFNKQKYVVFIYDELLHGFNWVKEKEKIRLTNPELVPVIEKNILDDLDNYNALAELGYFVSKFWKSQLREEYIETHFDILEAYTRDQFEKY